MTLSGRLYFTPPSFGPARYSADVLHEAVELYEVF
jgi:hypothetical protein